MDKKELVKTIRQNAGVANDACDEFLALNLPDCIASDINTIIKVREIPEDMWFDLFHLIVTIVDNEISREDR